MQKKTSWVNTFPIITVIYNPNFKKVVILCRMQIKIESAICKYANLMNPYFIHKTSNTNPISIKVGTLYKNAIKSKICNLYIHLNLY